MRETGNLPIVVVYWFLAGVAALFALLAMRELLRMRTQVPLEVRVAERKVRLEVREVSGKRSRYKAIFAVAELRLERLDNGAVSRVAEEGPVAKDAVIDLSFLDAWERGKRRAAVLRDGGVELSEGPRWGPLVGLGIGFWMFGTFAWMAKPFAEGKETSGVGLPFLALAVLPIGVAAWGIASNRMEEAAAKAVQRVRMEGRGREVAWVDFRADLAGRGVDVKDEVAQLIDSDPVRYCEYEWQGKRWRSVGLYVQVREGEVYRGQINPANPRDVKWGEEQ
jgi:hypothetical protein